MQSLAFDERIYLRLIFRLCSWRQKQEGHLAVAAVAASSTAQKMAVHACIHSSSSSGTQIRHTRTYFYSMVFKPEAIQEG